MTRASAWATTLFVLASIVPVAAAVPLSPAGDGHTTVPVAIDGHGPYPFILDSGADNSAVYQWFVDKAHLGKAKGGSEELSGQTGAAQVAMYDLGDVELDGHHLRHATAFGLPNRHDAGREAGVLGNDFMDGTIVAYDFPCRRVEIHAKPVDMDKLAGPGAPVVQAGIDAGTTLLTLPVTVNGFTGIAVLDTGSRNTRLTPRFARAAGIDAASPQFHDGVAIFGTSATKMVPRNGPIGSVRFGGVMIAHANGQVIDLPVLEHDFKGQPAMILGADLMGFYRVLYDHADRRVWFRPSQCHVPG